MNRRRAPKTRPARQDTLTAKALGARGDAVCEGPVYVPGLLPGETAELEIRGERGRVLNRLESAPERTQPFCPVAEVCGGCSLQHFEETAYQAWKRGLAQTALERAGISADLAPLVDAHGAGRRRVTFHAQSFGAKFVFGFAERAGDRLVDIAACPVGLSPQFDDLTALRELAKAAAPRKGRLDMAVAALEPGLDISISNSSGISLELRELVAARAAQSGWARVTIDDEPVIEIAPPMVKFGTAMVTPPPGGFLQATAAGEAALAAVVEAAEPGARSVIDLYAGSGAFALRLARTAHVLAVEGEAGPLQALNRAAERTPGLKPVDARVRDLALEPLGPKELEGADLVVLDPPRSGARAQCDRLADSAVPTIVSISCNPATFARDAAILMEGGYKIDGSVLPVDQFKWTGHLELAAVFRR